MLRADIIFSQLFDETYNSKQTQTPEQGRSHSTHTGESCKQPSCLGLGLSFSVETCLHSYPYDITRVCSVHGSQTVRNYHLAKKNLSYVLALCHDAVYV